MSLKKITQNAIFMVAFFALNIPVAQAQKAKRNKKQVYSTHKPKLPAFVDTLADYLKKQPAKIGVALEFIPYNDSIAFAQNPKQAELKPFTYSFNGYDSFVIMSVAKFPIAVYAMMQVERGILKLDMPIQIDTNDLKRDTYSPTVNGKESPFTITLKEAIDASVGLSDNITTDKIIEAVGGVEKVEDFIKALGYKNMHVRSSYKKMTPSTLGKNSSSPMAMNKMLFEFYYGLLTNPEHSKYLYELMKNTPTGPKRIRGLLPTSVEVAHKTGTYFNDEGIVAINDVGFIKTPKGLAILTIFVNNSKLTPEETELVIAKIAQKVFVGLEAL